MAALPDQQDASLRDLFDAAKLACEHWKDRPAALQAMEQECRAVSPHQRAELIEHFQSAYLIPTIDEAKESTE
ncbi:hypothetical protein [Paracidovorax anthurii]|uniref:Uncharacterized protein n=1 Tax=Paracidovorax anthurii TaxID=78229 RepID=A0A328ZF82_9BURK|nr:hypothetical protein [Paracidovorax anthurii]RAR85020.1 hypothetical protein AX018_1008113 [Paracidovorax anthurii]